MPSAINDIGFHFIALHSVDSTNNYAMGMVHAGMAQHGMVVFTHEQTQGKGQRGKQWLSQKNQNIALSVIIEPAMFQLNRQALFSMAIALGVRHFFSRHAGEETTIKWPNDIYWGDRKAAGILIENIMNSEKWKYAIAGIGININQAEFGELATKAISLLQITGQSYNTLLLAQELCGDLNLYFRQLLYQPDSILTEYNRHLYKRTQTVKLKKDNRLFEVTIKGVDMSGRLIVHHAFEEHFEVGAVEWVL